jgi:hypothetical protein
MISAKAAIDKRDGGPMRSLGKVALLFLAFLFSPSAACLAETESGPNLTPTESETIFLDRLMRAESGGRQFAKNPLSSALGPYQFLESTFLDVVKRNLPGIASAKSDEEILALRTDLKISRDAALIYTRENARALAAGGVEASAANLRLAFFAGAAGAARILQAKPDEPVSNLLGEAAIQANPFLMDMTASQLVARCGREAEGIGAIQTALPKSPASATKAAARCNLNLPSCRKWFALAVRRVGLRAAVAAVAPLRSRGPAPLNLGLARRN